MSDTTALADADLAAAPAARQLPGYPILVGPYTHLTAEHRRLTALTWQHFDARLVGATLGAEISGIDLRVPQPAEAIAELRQALHDYKVLFFRNQPITPEQHIALARRFGELEVHPALGANAEHPELVRFEKSADMAGVENAWHHDVTWRPQPSMGAILHAIEVPEIGGDTLFADMYAAYAGLDEQTRARIENLTATHDMVRAFGRFAPPDQQAKMRAENPSVQHPVACTHEATGRRHLYLNRAFVEKIDGMDPDASHELLDQLCRRSDAPEIQVRLHWQPHTIAFWDNRAVQHYAASDYWPQVRIMERASIIGARPAR